jgi:hypothetical protein
VRSAAIHRPSETSPYYPPRERWYSRFWYPWYLLKRKLHLSIVTDGFELPLYKLILGLTVPGLSWAWYGRQLFGLLTMTCYGLSAIVFLIWLGQPMGTAALAILMSIHTSSILFMNRRLTPDVELRKRIFWSLGVFALVNLLVYQPLRQQMERHWFMPLRIGDRVFVVKTGVSPNVVHRGDWVAYQIKTRWGEQTHVDEGYGLGKVSAVAGDTVSFQPNGFSVNGAPHPRLDNMPAQGDVTVADGSWFIWPDVAINGHGVRADMTENTMVGLAMVPKENFIGVVFHHWWWRKQTLP